MFSRRGRCLGVRCRAAGVAVLVAAFAGCGGGGGAKKPTPTATPTAAAASAPKPLESCRSAGNAWARLPTSGYYSPDAARAGNGRTGIVFANDSNNDACSWLGEARSLLGKGYAVAVFDAPSVSYEIDQAVSVIGALRRRAGVRRIVVIGASVGARAALRIGAEHPHAAVGLVALSAERSIRSDPSDLLRIAGRIHVPVLSVGSRQDPLTMFGKDTRAWDRTIPDVRTVVVSGSDHGVDFLHDRHRRRVRAAILTFIRSL
jgi:pimeloyl-ACP methyl ester carboxylesterase